MRKIPSGKDRQVAGSPPGIGHKGVPGTSPNAQNAIVDNGTTAQIPFNQPFATAVNLTIGNTVMGSTVQLQSFGDLEVTTLTIGTQGTLEFAATLNNESSFTGAISGPGRVIQDGTGTGNLTGNNTYTGSTTVSGRAPSRDRRPPSALTQRSR